jgi:hypothetical protein
MAFWMAIEALENEAALLEVMEGSDQAGPQHPEHTLAAQAKQDARILREIAGSRLPSQDPPASLR